MSNNKDRITERESLNINLVQPRGTANTDYNHTRLWYDDCPGRGLHVCTRNPRLDKECTSAILYVRRPADKQIYNSYDAPE